MHRSSAIAVFALVFSASPLLAQEADSHAGHHPEGAAPAPSPTPKATLAPEASDKGCPMMGKMKDGKMADQDMNAMQKKMKACMAANGKENEGSADQHQH